MSDEAGQPDDELAQAIRNAILAGADQGAEATARRIAAAANTGLGEITAVLQALAAEAAPQAITGSLSVSLPAAPMSVMAHVGSVHVAVAELSGFGTLGVGAADVAAAADELRVIRQPDVEELAGQPPVRWTKQELVLNSLFLVAVAYWLLPPAEQQYLAGMANLADLVTAVAAVMALLKKPKLSPRDLGHLTVISTNALAGGSAVGDRGSWE
jgi:hypothetical protein